MKLKTVIESPNKHIYNIYIYYLSNECAPLLLCLSSPHSDFLKVMQRVTVT